MKAILIILLLVNHYATADANQVVALCWRQREAFLMINAETVKTPEI
jgi:hypothetical protein